MKIDIKKLSEAELIDLNHKVIARIRFLRELRAHQSMMRLEIGERVSFTPPGRETIHGMITKFNRKSVSILTDDRRTWTVPPEVLERCDDERANSARDVNGAAQLPLM